MDALPVPIVLGSRSAQRLALLRQLIPEDRITVCPPRSSDEQEFDGLRTWEEIETRLQDIAREKCTDVVEQCQGRGENCLVLTADTTIVANGKDHAIVLGQPPEPDWRETAKFWFENYLLGKTHRAATAVCLSELSGKRIERVAVSEVTFSSNAGHLLEWYLDTEEPRGKAGGYGIQGAGSVFVTELKGSLSNVIGLPLKEIWEMFEELQVNWR
ncbi:MAG: Maf family protein [Planctomycetaceae bacterium]|nr:Maf family protein [Planctomycetaceae bacterium]